MWTSDIGVVRFSLYHALLVLPVATTAAIMEAPSVPPLDPNYDYTTEQLKGRTPAEIQRWANRRSDILKGFEEDIRRKSRLAGGGDVAMSIVEEPAAPAEQQFIGPVIPAGLIQKSQARKQAYSVPRGSLQLIGDKKALVAGYKDHSLCNTLVGDALQRAFLAMQLLDEKHADIIRARLAKAGVKNSNASHASSKEITFKKAVSIALQAERWVYQAQAAAAKSMAKESKHCLHNLAGHRKRTREEKEATYQKRFGKPRLDRSARAIRKKEEKLAELKLNQ